jgi:hypothetical protein
MKADSVAKQANVAAALKAGLRLKETFHYPRKSARCDCLPSEREEGRRAPSS